jgi:glutathione S-transferase
MRLMTKRIDDTLHSACGILTYAVGARPTMLARPAQEREALLAKIPDPAKREIRRAVIELGAEAPAFTLAMQTHQTVLDLADRALADAPWLAGDTFSLADCALAPYVLRADHLMLRELIDMRPHLAGWYSAVRARPSWESAVTRWLPDAVVDAFRNAGQALRITHPDLALVRR